MFLNSDKWGGKKQATSYIWSSKKKKKVIKSMDSGARLSWILKKKLESIPKAGKHCPLTSKKQIDTNHSWWTPDILDLLDKNFKIHVWNWLKELKKTTYKN